MTDYETTEDGVMNEWIAAIRGLERSLSESKAENARLRAALKPFAVADYTRRISSEHIEQARRVLEGNE